MKQELVRINSTDQIEQPGILYSPNDKTNKIVIHVHGLNSNFYENKFVDILAKAYTDKDYAFLTFNNRGTNFISQLRNGNTKITIGACFEKFKDCLLDIEGVVNWTKEKGYREIVLEGHSYGCDKVLYYYHHKKEDCIKKLVLLSPCDMPSMWKKLLSDDEYKKAKEDATKLVEQGNNDALIDFPILANKKIAAGTFYNDFLPKGNTDFIRYSEDITVENPVLNNIKIHVLIIIGNIDELVLTQPIEVVKKYLTKNITHCNIQVIDGSDHSFRNKHEELEDIIKKNI